MWISFLTFQFSIVLDISKDFNNYRDFLHPPTMASQPEFTQLFHSVRFTDNMNTIACKQLRGAHEINSVLGPNIFLYVAICQGTFSAH